jgi:hypothetical protein
MSARRACLRLLSSRALRLRRILVILLALAGSAGGASLWPTTMMTNARDYAGGLACGAQRCLIGIWCTQA